MNTVKNIKIGVDKWWTNAYETAGLSYLSDSEWIIADLCCRSEN
ncbi:hypothetical protein [Kaistella faecalis]|nr:hypothetical protein [Chryseobacterium faecale]